MDIKFASRKIKQQNKWNTEKLRTFGESFINNKETILQQQKREQFATFSTIELYKNFYTGENIIKYYDYYTRKFLLQTFQDLDLSVNISANKEHIQIVILE